MAHGRFSIGQEQRPAQLRVGSFADGQRTRTAPLWEHAAVEFADTPEPPYYVAVITVRRTGNTEGYAAAADQMHELARTQPGFLGMEWVSSGDGQTGITASYWTDAEAIAAWKAQADHVAIQRVGQERWYEAYSIRIARVERDYGWEQAPD